MPSDAVTIIPAASGITGSGALNYYSRWLSSSTLGTGNLTDYADASGSYCNGKFTASGNISAANISATPGVGTIAQGDGAGHLNSWISGLPESSVANLATDLSNRPTGTSGTTNQIPKWTSASSLGNSALSDNGTSVKVTSATYGEPGVFHTNSGGDKVILYDDGSSFDARVGVGTAGDVWVKAAPVSGNGGAFRVYAGSASTEVFDADVTGIYANNISATRTPNNIAKMDSNGQVNALVGNHVDMISTETPAGTITIPVDDAWHTVDSANVNPWATTGAFVSMSGTVTVHGASITGITPKTVKARLVFDSTEVVQIENDLVYPANAVSLSPVGTASYGSGASHTVYLQALCGSAGGASNCQVQTGQAFLVVTQYSN